MKTKKPREWWIDPLDEARAEVERLKALAQRYHDENDHHRDAYHAALARAEAAERLLRETEQERNRLMVRAEAAEKERDAATTRTGEVLNERDEALAKLAAERPGESVKLMIAQPPPPIIVQQATLTVLQERARIREGLEKLPRYLVVQAFRPSAIELDDALALVKP